jgi:hypothetical protein
MTITTTPTSTPLTGAAPVAKQRLRDREPLATNATLFDSIKTLVLATIAVLVGFDVVTWSDQQISLVISLVAALFVVLTSLCTLNTRAKVTPVHHPRDDDGNPLEPARH